MFEPGHLRIQHLPAIPDQRAFTLDLYYEVRRDPAEGPMLVMRMHGDVEGHTFEDRFELHADSAFDFARVASLVAARHGLTSKLGLVMTHHGDYDRMFEDIRQRLGIQPGDPIDFEHFDKDHL